MHKRLSKAGYAVTKIRFARFDRGEISGVVEEIREEFEGEVVVRRTPNGLSLLSRDENSRTFESGGFARLTLSICPIGLRLAPAPPQRHQRQHGGEDWPIPRIGAPGA